MRENSLAVEDGGNKTRKNPAPKGLTSLAQRDSAGKSGEKGFESRRDGRILTETFPQALPYDASPSPFRGVTRITASATPFAEPGPDFTGKLI